MTAVTTTSTHRRRGLASLLMAGELATASVRVEDRLADELLPLLLTDARHAQPSGRTDFLWVRPLDVAGMLATRFCEFWSGQPQR